MLVHGRFVQRDRALVREAGGWGRHVTAIQAMPAPRHQDQPLAAVLRG
jgi:hypothetical protein